jgi:ribosomal protein S18 acetylase RimI-like enzyme
VRLSQGIVDEIQQLQVELRRLRGPRANWHVGDIAWGARQHAGREAEWRIRLWADDGRTVAWSWLRTDAGTLDFDVHPDHLHLLDELLDEPQARTAPAFEDDEELRAVLARHGFVRPEDDRLHFLVRDLTEAPEPPPLPNGFRCRTMTDADFADRVAAHRDVWSRPGRPSRVTEASYAQVQQAWPYRPSLDCVVEAPDGRIAAFCLCWPDDANSVGEFEPVGTREEYRRLGLGAAVCTFGLRRLHEEGIRQAIVYCVTEPACALYESLGFQRHATLVGYART